MKFTAWPEMLLWPYLITKGWLPYKDFAMVHSPNLVALLSVFSSVFGVGVLQLKIFTWIVIIATDLILYYILSKVWRGQNKKILFTLVVFCILQVFYDGNGLWFEVAMTPVAILLFYLTSKKRYFMSGVIWVVLLFTKQTAIWFLLPIALSFAHPNKVRTKDIRSFMYGSLFSGFCFFVLIWAVGILPDFYKWAVEFGVFVLPKSQGQIQLPSPRSLLVSLFVYGVFVPLVLRNAKKYLWILTWAVAGALGAYPRFEYFHFQPAIPFLSMAIADFVYGLSKKTKYESIFLVLSASTLFLLVASFAIRNVGEGVRFYENDVVTISDYLKTKTTSTEKIFVINYWDSIYALADREPAVDFWVPQLPWYMEMQGIQDKMVDSLKENEPNVIVIKPYTKSGLSSYIPDKIYSYIIQNYIYKESLSGLDLYYKKINI